MFGVSSTTLTAFVFALAVLSQLQDDVCGYMALFWRPQKCEQVIHANLQSTPSTVKSKNSCCFSYKDHNRYILLRFNTLKKLGFRRAHSESSIL